MKNQSHPPLHKSPTLIRRSWCRFTLLMLWAAAAPAADLLAQQRIPGEVPTGLFHTVTHLHPAAYIILLFVFLLSAVNLVFQFGLSRLIRPFLSLVSIFRRESDMSVVPPVLKGLKRSRIGNARPESETRTRRSSGNFMPRDEAVIAVRRPAKPVQTSSATVIPTPLEGVNHPLPALTEPSSREPGTPRVAVSHSDRKMPSSEFKFSSAVDVPTPEEIERREKTQLMVSGSVLGPDGKGVPSVIVFLTDEEGNRVGQSFRSMPETGEFKVLINEPGKYRLNGYKRGFVMDLSDPPKIPIESGKIEGFNIRMIPEGCVVSGRVIREDGGTGISGREVTCICRANNYSRSAETDSDGHFRISGVPVNSECFLEVKDREGDLPTATDTFQTVQKKELYSEIRIAAPRPESPAGLQVSEDPGQETPGATDAMNVPGEPADSGLLSPTGSTAPPAP
ncbi:MAG: carboxypeptidase-like regulatory domain-containing protein [Pseudomonadota bacterium]